MIFFHTLFNTANINTEVPVALVFQLLPEIQLIGILFLFISYQAQA